MSIRLTPSASGPRLAVFPTLAVLAAFAALAVLAAPVRAEVLELKKDIGRTTVEYKVVLPDGYDPARAYPGVLVFGGGPQTMRTIEGTIDRNFRDEAERRGLIVIGPAAPNGELFFQGGERVLPAFLDMVLRDYRIERGKFHVAGPSNGGIAALHVAARNPEYFLSATAFPGYLWQPTSAKLEAITGICIFMYVGEHDEYRWHDEMQREVEFLTARGTLARYSLEPGQPHRLETLAGANAGRLFDGFEEAQRGCRHGGI